MATGKRYDNVPTSPDYPRGGRSEMDWDLSNMFLAMLQVCWHCLAGGENCLNILIDWHDMCVKAFIHIMLDSK